MITNDHSWSLGVFFAFGLCPNKSLVIYEPPVRPPHPSDPFLFSPRDNSALDYLFVGRVFQTATAPKCVNVTHHPPAFGTSGHCTKPAWYRICPANQYFSSSQLSCRSVPLGKMLPRHSNLSIPEVPPRLHGDDVAPFLRSLLALQ